MNKTPPTQTADEGRRLGNRARALGLLSLAIVLAMMHVFVLSIGGWHYVHAVGLGAAFFRRFAQALALTGAEKTAASVAAWRYMYAILGLLGALMVVGKLLEGTLAKLKRFRRFREQQEWANA